MGCTLIIVLWETTEIPPSIFVCKSIYTNAKYLDLLTKTPGGISVVSQKIIIRVQPMDGLREDWWRYE